MNKDTRNNHKTQARDSQGRFAREYKEPKKQKAKQTPVTHSVLHIPAEPEKKLVNHIALLVDESGSMSTLRQATIDAFNKQIAAIKQESHKSGQSTYLSVYTFSSGKYPTVRRLCYQAWYESAPFLSTGNYSPAGRTPLVDAFTQVIRELDAVSGAGDANTSFLVIMLTDGQENESSVYNKSNIRELIQRRTGTKRWTFAYAGPRGAAQELGHYGIPVGNFTEWEQSEAGMNVYASLNSSAFSNYTQARAQGLTSTSNYFSPDFKDVNSSSLKKLKDLNNQFRQFVIRENDCQGKDAKGRQAVEISEFVQKHGLPYQVSKGFYQLTKPEDIQDHKELAIKDIRTGEIYGGREAKDLLKLPQGGTIRVKPGQFGDYKLFVQSTSMNRKLIAGTEFLYKV